MGGVGLNSGLTEVFKNGSSDTRQQKGWCSALLEELSEIIGLQVYTHNGVFLGNVNNLVVDVDNGAVDGIFVGETNPLLVEGSRAVSVPYRWVQSVGDIVVLRYFPKRVSLRKGSAAPPIAAAAK
jgi:sporulation protein YlmC with PRC-barrel domain